MLDIYLHDGAGAITFRLVGQLTAAGADELEQSWITASSILKNRDLLVDLTSVTEVDERGEQVLTKLGQQGARFITGSASGDALASKISARRPAELPSDSVSGWCGFLYRLRQCILPDHAGYGDDLPCPGGSKKLW